MSNPTSLKGPVELIDGKLTLMIPLNVGGSDLVACTKGIAKIEGEFLKITFPDWLVSKLGWIQNGTILEVDNKGGKFNFSPISNSNDEVTDV